MSGQPARVQSLGKISPRGTAAWLNAGIAFVRKESLQQTGRGFLWCVVSFVLGIGLFFTWPFDPHVATGPLVIAIGLLLWIYGRRWTSASLLGAFVIAAGWGHAAAQIKTWVVATPTLERELGPVFIDAQIVRSDRRPNGNRVVVEGFEIPGLASSDTPRRLRLTLPASHGLPDVGTRIRVRVMIRPAGSPVVPDGFQFQRFLYFSQIGGTGFSLGQWETLRGDEESNWFDGARAWVENLRRQVGDRITKIVPGPDGTVAAALINGEQSAIPQDLQEAYRISGIAHLLSISGVHMSLLAGIVFFLVRRVLALTSLAARTDTKKIAAWAGLAATGFYLLISGMSIPAVRAFMMVSVVLAAILFDRTALSLRTLAWAALCLTVFFPDAVFGPSFQMSFLAVLSLVALYEQAWLKIRWRTVDSAALFVRTAGLYVVALVVTDLVAGGATALFAAYHFNRLPSYSLLANLLAVPITGAWIMPLGLLGLILMPLGLDRIPFEAMGFGVTLINDIARSVSMWPGAQIHMPPMSTSVMILAALGIVFVCLWNGRLRWLGFNPVLIAMAQPHISSPPDLLVDESSRVFAVSDDSGHLVFRPGRVGRFVREVWTDRYGASPTDWPAPGETQEELGLTCDSDGCIFERRGQRVLMAFRANAIAEDCGEPDVIVSAIAVHDLCRANDAYDIIDFRRDGTHAFWFGDGDLRIRTSVESAGDRIWTR